MKSIFLYLFLGILFIGCKPKSSNKFDDITKGIGNNIASKPAWSSEDKQKLMDDCVRKPGQEKGGTKEQCDCLLAQAEKYFSSFQVYDESKEENTEWKLNGDNFNKAVENCRSQFADKKDDKVNEKKEVDIWGETKETDIKNEQKVVITTVRPDNLNPVEMKSTDKVRIKTDDSPVYSNKEDDDKSGGWSSTDKRRFMKLYPSNSTQLRQCWLKVAETYFDSYEAYSNAGSKSTEYYRALLECRSKYPN